MIVGHPATDALAALDAICRRIAAAMAHHSVRKLPGVRTFPTGACTWASFAGGELMQDLGLGEWTLWNASTADQGSRHDWLVQGDLFVDLTAHQFPDHPEHLVGVGPSPLSVRFPDHLLSVPTSKIDEHPDILTFKHAVAAVLTSEGG